MSGSSTGRVHFAEPTEADRAALRAEWDRDRERANSPWRDAAGNPIDLPTVMQEFARAVDTRFGAIEVQYDGVRDRLERNTEVTEKTAATLEKMSKDMAELIEVQKAANGFKAALKWLGEVGKGIFWVAATCAVAGSMIYGNWIGPKLPATTGPTAAK